MCGIFGIFKLQNNTIGQDDISIAEELGCLLEHRGPDGKNCVIVNKNLILGHTRLSINDVEGGAQPFKNKYNSHLVANGEIYSYNKLKRDYPEITKELKTHSDCEILMPLMQKYGYKALNMISGMFSIGFYDDMKNKLVLGRDVFGEKPLYYYKDKNSIIFSSEFRPLFKCLGLSPMDLGEDFFYEFILLGYPIIKNNSGLIRQVSRGKVIEIEQATGKVQEISYAIENKAKDVNMTSTLEEYMESSTISDVPICMGLSGGLDSTLVMTKLNKSIAKAYTIGYEAAGGSDEVSEAKNIADYFGVEHKAEIIKNAEVASLFRAQATAKDLPINDIAGIGYYKLYKSMNRDNYKVCLMGHGGDELFMGYPWLYRSLQIARRNKSEILYETLDDFRMYRKLTKIVFSRDLTSLYWKSYDLKKVSNNTYLNTLGNVNEYWLEPNSLKMADSLSMAVSLETRQPLLCSKVIGEINNLLNTTGEGAGKNTVKQILRKSIPEKLIQNKKKYFAPPYMKFYAIIHNQLSRETRTTGRYLLEEMEIFNKEILRAVIYGSEFRSNALNYYLFPRLATMHYWLETLIG